MIGTVNMAFKHSAASLSLRSSLLSLSLSLSLKQWDLSCYLWVNSILKGRYYKEVGNQDSGKKAKKEAERGREVLTVLRARAGQNFAKKKEK